MFHSKITYPFPQKSHECALKLTDLLITSLLFDIKYNLLMGASLLALAKSIYYAESAKVLENVLKIYYKEVSTF